MGAEMTTATSTSRATVEVSTTQQQRDALSRLRFAGWNILAIEQSGENISASLMHHMTDQQLTYTVDTRGRRVDGR